MKDGIRYLWLLVLLTGCGGGGSGDSGEITPPPPPPASLCVDRGEICADELLADATSRLTDDSYYLPVDGSGIAMHDLMGTLTIQAAAMTSSLPEQGGRQSLPAFSVQFMTVDDRLLPLERDVIRRESASEWDIILSPGRVWSEPTDHGMSRASFPFTLVTDKWNEAHNGVATFLFNDATVSNLRFQVTQETALWNKISFWGVVPMTYSPEVIANVGQIAQDFRDEIAARVEVQPWSVLVDEIGAPPLAEFTRNIQGGEISSTGILIDNTLYYQESATRTGSYPYPLEMRHGVFSVTKSAGAALTMLRLAEKYGTQVFDLFVSDYLDVNVNHNGWNGVTFGHLLNMAAGIGNNSPDPNATATFADENDSNSPIWQDLWNARRRATRLEHAFRYDNYPWAPGQIVRYNTAHTYILGAAMDSFYKAMAGPDANVWQMMLDEVYEPIGISVLPMIVTRDEDALPLYGFGLFLNAYDTARILQLLQNDGAWNGQQILHSDRTRQSLYRSSDTGYTTYASIPTTGAASQRARYLNSFWSFTLPGPDSCVARIPYMWGFGGNFVVVLPNGVSAFRYADGDVHDPVALGLAAGAIRPAC